ncbi:AlpA family phage regulatory protein [Acidiphilium multivorum]|uniref:helix-turn-helix transcriptional regulator n=1 Tax=Acidiphilium multivorum TaxID=62140 RepID=UPI001F4C17BF|nr:AlpA family phage regulatory protein [Acidiphilium multivorum]UNC15595.1 AlpA family phage regulatory protein [Acidiphilium multivorum]
MKFIRYQQLRERGIPWTRVHLNRLIKAGEFPAPVNLGGNSIAWIESEVEDWAKKKAESREPVAA